MIDEWGKGAKYWDHAWNPIIGCHKVSEGCANCYAAHMAERFPELRDASGGFEPHQPRHLKRPPSRGVVFVGNMTDIFGEWNNPLQIVEWFTELDDGAENLILTKRPDRMAKMIAGIDPIRRAWWGTTAENADRYAERILNLWRIRTPQVKTWLSLEPLIGPIDLTIGHYRPLPYDWVVVGAESGPNRRPCKLEWVRQIVWQCGKAGVPVFVKQLDIGGNLVKDIEKFPEDLQIRQVPWGKDKK